MGLQYPARSRSLAWSNPLAWWWSLLTLVSAINIAAWFSLYHVLETPRAGGLGGASGVELMLFLCAAYVFGCAFRSFLPRADVQRICLFDTWLSSVIVGRSVATVAELCFAAQWAIILHQLGAMRGADTTLNAAWLIVPLILIAECFSWHAVLTKKYVGNAIENSIWALTFFIVGLAFAGCCRSLTARFARPSSWRSSASPAISRFSRPSTCRCIWRDGAPNLQTAADLSALWRVCATRAFVGS